MQIPWPYPGLNQNIWGPTPPATDTARPGTGIWGPLAAAGEVRLQNNNETRLKDTLCASRRREEFKGAALGRATGSQRVWQPKRVCAAVHPGGAGRVTGPGGHTPSGPARVGRSAFRLQGQSLLAPALLKGAPNAGR